MSSNGTAWAIAFAFVGMCFAIAYANVYAPPVRDAQIVCIEQRGKWVQGFGSRGSCDFQPAEAAVK